MVSKLTQFIRVKARSRAVVVGVAAVATLALAGGWALAASNSGHQATGSAALSSARHTTPAQAENGTGAQSAGPQGSTGGNLASVALGPELVKKPSPKRPDPGPSQVVKNDLPERWRSNPRIDDHRWSGRGR